MMDGLIEEDRISYRMRLILTVRIVLILNELLFECTFFAGIMRLSIVGLAIGVNGMKFAILIMFPLYLCQSSQSNLDY